MTLSFDPETDERYAAWRRETLFDPSANTYECFQRLLDAGLIVESLPPKPRVDTVTLALSIPGWQVDDLEPASGWDWGAIIGEHPALCRVGVRVVEGDQP